MFMWDRIDQRLAQLGWKDADLARELSVSGQYVNNWRKRGLPPSRFAEVAIALRMPQEWLLTEDPVGRNVREESSQYTDARRSRSSETNEIAAVFLSLDARDRANLLEIGNTLARNASLPRKSTKQQREKPFGQRKKVPAKGAPKG